MFPLSDGPSQIPPSPEKLDEVNIRLLFCTVEFENGTLYCSAWQRFPTVIPCPCGSISYWWMTVLDAAPSEGSEITGVQLRLALLSFTHWNSSRFLQCFNEIFTVEGEICKSLPIFLWRTLFLNTFVEKLKILWTSLLLRDSVCHGGWFWTKLQSPVWNNFLKTLSLLLECLVFYIIGPKLLTSNVRTIFNVLQVWNTKWMYIINLS